MTSLLEEYGETAADVYFEPVQEDILLPVQLAKTSQPHWTRVILSALVEGAIADAIMPIIAKHGNYRNQLIRFRDEALAWIASDERSLAYPTFQDSCDRLGLNPELIRKAIAKPGFVLATEWNFRRPDAGLGRFKCGGENLLQKIDQKAERRSRAY